MKRANHGARAILVVSLLFAMCASPLLAKDYIYVPVNDALQIIDCETDTVVKTLPVFSDYIMQSAYSPDGKRYYLSAQHSVYAFDTTTNTLADTYNFSTELSKVAIIAIAVSEDNSRLFLSCNIVKKKQNIPKLNVLPPMLIVYDLKKRKIVKNYKIPYMVFQVFPLRKDPDRLLLLGADLVELNLKDGSIKKRMGILNPGPGEEAKNCLAIWSNGSPGDHGVFTTPYYTAAGIGYLFIDRNTGKINTIAGKDVWFEYSTILSPDKKYMYGVMDELVK
ncbi:MAG: hypothetical protein GY859_34655, partial [Desulfobacterales bacterium]|nr:hypothetical protein [Desulfobacterales bacterium]